MRLFPENPHYVEFRGQPTLLIGSGEHYGGYLRVDLPAHAGDLLLLLSVR